MCLVFLFAVSFCCVFYSDSTIQLGLSLPNQVAETGVMCIWLLTFTLCCTSDVKQRTEI